MHQTSDSSDSMSLIIEHINSHCLMETSAQGTKGEESVRCQDQRGGSYVR